MFLFRSSIRTFRINQNNNHTRWTKKLSNKKIEYRVFVRIGQCRSRRSRTSEPRVHDILGRAGRPEITANRRSPKVASDT